MCDHDFRDAPSRGCRVCTQCDETRPWCEHKWSRDNTCRLCGTHSEAIQHLLYENLATSNVCSNCGGIDTFVENRDAGSMMCEGCGMESNEQILDATREARILKDQTAQERAAGERATMQDTADKIQQSRAQTGVMPSLEQAAHEANATMLTSREKQLMIAHECIGRFALTLGYAESVAEQAKGYLLCFRSPVTLRKLPKPDVLAVVLLCFTLEQHGIHAQPSDLGDIVLAQSIKKKVTRKRLLSRASLAIHGTLEPYVRKQTRELVSPVRTEVNNICVELELTPAQRHKVQQLLEREQQHGIMEDHKPLTRAAVIVFACVGTSTLLSEISRISGVTESTIRTVYSANAPVLC